MKHTLLPFLAAVAVLAPTTAAAAPAAKRPNIVWIVSEDNSHFYLKDFFEGGAATPNIEALGAHGLTYDHAFSNAPVCSVARTSLATGCYAPRIGAEFHRRYKMANLPEGLHMFPRYLRQAGYYTTNKVKQDYNVTKNPDPWDKSSNTATWRNRPDKTQPFFHMQTFVQSHESSLHFGKDVYENEKTTADPAKVPLAECFPDTPLFRYTHARYLDRIGIIDDIVGLMVKQLEEDGVLEDTFIFYFGDNGGVLPRGKGYAYDGGLHVPLVVRVPEHFAHLVDAKLGTRMKGFVSFVDFGPTVLNLAGAEIPKGIDGRPFLGKGVSTAEVEKRDEAFGYADRMDEKYDFVRSLRKGRYQYLRSYQPWLPDGLQNNYRYKMLAYQEWRDLFKAGKLKGAPARFFEPKPAEALYDIETDPHCVRNLAGNPKHAAKLAELRKRFREIVKGLPDLSFYPESWLVAHAMDNPVAFGQANKKEIAEMVDIADLQFAPFDEAKAKLVEALKSEKWTHRYWGAMACTAHGKEAADLADLAMPLLKDNSEVVRIRAAEFLGLIGKINPQPVLAEVVNTTSSPVVGTEALNSVVWFRDFFGDRYPVKAEDFHPVATKGGDVQRRLAYIAGELGTPKKKRGKNPRRGKRARKSAKPATR